MDLAMEVAVRGEAAVAACYGRIVYGETANAFGSCVGDLIARHQRVVLNLSGVTHCDARGLGTLATLIRTGGGYQGRLVMASTSERVARLLRLTRLDTQIRRAELPSRARRQGPSTAAALTHGRSRAGPAEHGDMQMNLPGPHKETIDDRQAFHDR